MHEYVLDKINQIISKIKAFHVILNIRKKDILMTMIDQRETVYPYNDDKHVAVKIEYIIYCRNGVKLGAYEVYLIPRNDYEKYKNNILDLISYIEKNNNKLIDMGIILPHIEIIQ